MRIGVYAPRRSSFPLIGPPAMEAIKRGHEVTLLHDTAGGQLGDTWDDGEALPGASVSALHDYRGDWLMLALWGRAGMVAGMRIASLEPWLDSLALPYPDAAALTHRTMRHGLIPTDAVAACPIGRQRLITWFLPKTRVPGLLNRALRYLTMFVTARVLDRACSAHGMALVVKTRRKIRVPRGLRHLTIVGEERLYPSDQIRLIAQSSLVVCHQSAAAIEAAALGTPCLNVRVPIPHLRKFPQHALMSMRTNSPMAWPGLVDSIALVQLPRWTPHTSVDPVARQTYVDTWLGGKAQGASAWVLDRMEQC